MEEKELKSAIKHILFETTYGTYTDFDYLILETKSKRKRKLLIKQRNVLVGLDIDKIPSKTLTKVVRLSEIWQLVINYLLNKN